MLEMHKSEARREPCDVAIIGAGPSGLFAATMCGLLGLSAVVFDSLSHVGGQCAALYPQKTVYGVPGIVGISAKDFVCALAEQALSFATEFCLGTRIRQVSRCEGDCWQVGGVVARTVLVAVGMGSFLPNKPDVEGLDRFEGSHLHYHVGDVANFRDKSLVIAGGGDAAVDWTLALAPLARSITLVHRRDTFRCASSSLERLEMLARRKEITILCSSQLLRLEGQEHLEEVIVATPEGEKKLPADDLLVFFGILPNLEDVSSWGIAMKRQRIVVDPLTMATNQQGIFAIGDAVTYEGKINLLTTGFHEAVVAAYSIQRYLHPNTPLQKNVSGFKPA